jgi:hypothetical protein
MTSARECPKCLRLRRTKPEKTPGWCSRCGRWQSLYQAPFLTFHEAVFKHLACVACGQGAWCRDFPPLVDLEQGDRCSYRAHVHAPGECPAQHNA